VVAPRGAAIGKGRLQGVSPGAAVAWSSWDLTFPGAWCSVGVCSRFHCKGSRGKVNGVLQSR
jgi:hypothetical protein